LINERRSPARGRGRRDRRFVHDESRNRSRRARARADPGRAAARARSPEPRLPRRSAPLRRAARYGEIAAITGAGVSAVVRVARARDAMRPGLEAVFHE
jgi:hypothetical protein